MIVFNERELNSLLRGIAGGFGPSTRQVILLAAFLVAAVLILVVVAVLQRRRERRRSRPVLGSMQPRSRGAPQSTERLAPGTVLGIAAADGARAVARVVTVEPEQLVLRVERGRPEAVAGSPLRLYLHNERGIHVYEAGAGRLAEGLVRVPHAGPPQSTQRRRYFRRRVALPAQVALAAAPEEWRSTKVLDLSGGGALLANPGLEVQAGGELRLRVGLPGPVELECSVVRLSRDRRTMSLRFVHLSEGVRDRIVAYLYRRP